MDKFVKQRARLECTARPSEAFTSTTTASYTANRPTTTTDDSNCLNSVHASASANTAVVEESAQYDSSNSCGIRPQVELKHRKLSERRMHRWPWLRYNLPTESFLQCMQRSQGSKLATDQDAQIANIAFISTISATGSMLYSAI